MRKYSNVTADAVKMRNAIDAGNHADMQALLTAGYAVDQAVLGNNAASALHLVAQCGDADMLSMLLRAGANLERRDAYGNTPLAIVSRYVVCDDMCWPLLAAGARTDVKNKKGQTPLHRAACRPFFSASVCAMLLRAKADLWAQNNSEETPLHLVKDVVGWLFFKEAGIDPHYVPPNPSVAYLTPFQHMVKTGRAEIVRHCMAQGNVDLGQRSLAGRTLPQLAARSPQVRALLLSAKTDRLIRSAIGPLDLPAMPAPRRASGMTPL